MTQFSRTLLMPKVAGRSLPHIMPSQRGRKTIAHHRADDPGSLFAAELTGALLDLRIERYLFTLLLRVETLFSQILISLKIELIVDPCSYCQNLPCIALRHNLATNWNANVREERGGCTNYPRIREQWWRCTLGKRWVGRAGQAGDRGSNGWWGAFIDTLDRPAIHP